MAPIVWLVVSRDTGSFRVAGDGQENGDEIFDACHIWQCQERGLEVDVKLNGLAAMRITTLNGPGLNVCFCES